MLMRPLIALCLAMLLSSGMAMAQTPTPDPNAPAAPATPRHRRAHTPAATPPATDPAATPAAAPATPPAAPSPRTPRATIPAGTKVNLNTATGPELDALPEIGKARLKVIMTERAKGNYKDWDDFEKRMQHTSVNAGVRAKIKDLVTF